MRGSHICVGSHWVPPNVRPSVGQLVGPAAAGAAFKVDLSGLLLIVVDSVV